MLAQLHDLWRDYDLTVGLSGIVLEIFLMIVFGLVEGLEGHNLCYDWLLPELRGVRFLDNLLRNGLLFGIVVEDCRSILGSYVSSLTVERGRVVGGEEDQQDILEGDLSGIEGYL